MSVEERRLGCVLKFNTEQEADILAVIDTMTQHRKLGEYVGQLIRLHHDNPELFKASDVYNLMGLGEHGLAGERREYFSKINQEMLELKRKVDSIHDMCVQMKAAVQYQQIVAPSEHVELTAGANAILKKHADKLSLTLGLGASRYLYEHEKTTKYSGDAEDVLKYLLHVYESLLLPKQDDGGIPKGIGDQLKSIEMAIKESGDKQADMMGKFIEALNNNKIATYVAQQDVTEPVNVDVQGENKTQAQIILNKIEAESEVDNGDDPLTVAQKALLDDEDEETIEFGAGGLGNLVSFLGD